MFKLVLVDDKKDIVQGIAAAVDWASMEVETVCFYNGRDARDYLLEEQADMVISDIRMPFLSGLELAREVLAKYPQIRFILLTGYDEFSYARDAIRLGIVEYLSKPVKIEEIKELVCREKARAAELKQHAFSQKDIQLRYNRSLPLVKSRWIHKFLKGDEEFDRETVEAKLLEFGVDLDAEHLLAVLMEVDRGQETDELMQYAMENIGKEILFAEHPCETFCMENGRVLFLISYPAAVNKSFIYYQLYQPLMKIQSAFCEYFRMTISIGIGDVIEGVEGVRESCRQAAAALDYKFYLGNSKIISPMDIPRGQDGQKSEYPHAAEQELLSGIREHSQDVEARLEAYFQALRTFQGIAPARLQEIMMEVLLQICNLCSNEVEFHMVDVLEEFRHQKTLDDMQQWLLNFIRSMTGPSEEEGNSDLQRNILKVKLYMDEHYTENITLKKMADYVYLSPSYLSFSFKEILGVNFNEYLGRLRIEKAKELLGSTNYRVYEVCSMVGYSDKKYFTDLFRRYTGMLPKEWARKEKEE
ncbi:MAG: response regulator [Lachnospiraceae bacterium]|nr:response regulator [Lachnospiraceae bacterium]